LGIPTVTIVTSEFTALAKDTAFSQGVAEMSLVTVPHPMGMISRPEIRRKADNAFAQILKSAMRWKPKAQLPPMRAPYPAARVEFGGSSQEVNRFFFDKGWSMGLPIIPPTAERVARILKGTTRSPGEVLGIVPPRMGVLTVELAAVHAAMAGCKPEYMPVLMAALEALLAPEANWRGAGTTTGTTAMLVILNGPIVKEIGIAYGQGAAGKGHHANASIGYAMNSIAYSVGGSKPPTPDKGTLSAPSDFTGWIFGENEDALPRGWAPFHVDRGFRRADSVVTVMGTYPPVDNIDHWSATPEEHIRWWAHLITPMINMGGPCSAGVMDLPNIIAMGPEHAQTVAGAAWTKEQFVQAFWEQARIPLSAWPKGCSPKILEQKFGPANRNTLIPITLRPELFYIVIAGGAGKHSHYFAPFPGCLPVSKKVSK
jgi:hypothetical protein